MALSTLPSSTQHHGPPNNNSNDNSRDKDGKPPHSPRFPGAGRPRLRCRICGATLDPQPARSLSKGAPRPKRAPVTGVHRYRNGGIIECPYSTRAYALPQQVNRMVIAEAAEAAGMSRGGRRRMVLPTRIAPRSEREDDDAMDEDGHEEEEEEEEEEDDDGDEDDDNEEDDESSQASAEESSENDDKD
ncbi:hypothetical protein SAPIO_CDS5245 [Scedosporium apiospermum]|uniref:Uncharacterized protein n=1 Tax=Pseudallescheria apiosperma TaxID=563466 RepID=A0A084G663_PSEDA|nr:uncharacterized protein SAPIO_CDS5245 [Scedosporium apiospermum]KEZ42825.1 hypothetical protein SAPIO_CDS5245 [Scedosporium apiospermum]